MTSKLDCSTNTTKLKSKDKDAQGFFKLFIVTF